MNDSDKEITTNPRGRPPPEKLLEATYDLAHANAETTKHMADGLLGVKTEMAELRTMVATVIAPKTFPRGELRALVAVFAIAVLAYLTVNHDAVIQVAR